jgi:hypothetical protein
MHSYEIPCIIKIDAEANEEFERWINESTTSKNDDCTNKKIDLHGKKR